MRIFTVCLMLVLLTSSAGAETPADRKQVKSMVKQLKGLHKAGIQLHKQYDLENIGELKACVAENKHHRDQGKKLMSQAKDTTIPMTYRTNLVFAADAAFRCVYCSKDSLKSCSEIPTELAEIEMKLKQ